MSRPLYTGANSSVVADPLVLYLTTFPEGAIAYQ
jgi:hypothetical protein